LPLTRFSKFGSTSYLVFFLRVCRGWRSIGDPCRRRLFLGANALLGPAIAYFSPHFVGLRRTSPHFATSAWHFFGFAGGPLGFLLRALLRALVRAHSAYRRAQGMTTSPRSKRRAPRMFRTFSWGGPPRLTRPDSMGAGASCPRRWASRRSILAEFQLADISTTLRRVGRLGDREAVYR
jgi:hypothetical protein